MEKIAPTELCEYLASRISQEYSMIRFKDCVFNARLNELTLTFLYDESIKNKMDELKTRLEQEYMNLVDLKIKYAFIYVQSYMDSERLLMLTQEFLRNNFSIMTLDIGDDDIKVKKGEQGYTVSIWLPKQTADYIKASKTYEKFICDLTDNYFAVFNFIINIKEVKEKQEELTLENIEQFVKNKIFKDQVNKVDKTCKIKNSEYYLGKPIKERPIKIEFLRVSNDEQIIAGTINMLTRREYTKKDKTGEGKDEQKSFWTFVLDDGNKKQSCVFFPNEKNFAKFEKLVNGTTVCIIGVNSERNGRVNFSVKGIALCEMA